MFKPSTRMQTKVRVLGVDPGYDRLGLSIIERSNGKDALIYSTCFQTPKTLVHAERLYKVGQEVARVIAEFIPSILAIETLFFSKNQKTALLVAEARGVILAIAAGAGLSIQEFSPAAVKIAVTGYGRAEKSQLISMVPRIVSMPARADNAISKRHDDEFDAIAVGLACTAHLRVTSPLKRM